jgi:hypothetical protein
MRDTSVGPYAQWRRPHSKSNGQIAEKRKAARFRAASVMASHHAKSPNNSNAPCEAKAPTPINTVAMIVHSSAVIALRMSSPRYANRSAFARSI